MISASVISYGRRHFVQGAAAFGFLLSLSCPSFAGAYEDFFRAVRIDDAGKVKSLLARGFDPNAVEPERGENGLMIAIRENSAHVIEVLLNTRGIDFESKAKNGDTVLMIACYKGNLSVVQALLGRDVEVNRPGWTPLHYAAAAGQDEIVKLLLDHSAYIDAESPNKTTPIMMAALNNHIYTVKLLLDEGADVTLKNEQGLDAVAIAEMNGYQDIAEGLRYRLRKAGKLP